MSKDSYSKDKDGKPHQKTVTSDSGRFSTTHATYKDGFPYKKTGEYVNKPDGTTKKK